MRAYASMPMRVSVSLVCVSVSLVRVSVRRKELISAERAGSISHHKSAVVDRGKEADRRPYGAVVCECVCVCVCVYSPYPTMHPASAPEAYYTFLHLEYTQHYCHWGRKLDDPTGLCVCVCACTALTHLGESSGADGQTSPTLGNTARNRAGQAHGIHDGAPEVGTEDADQTAVHRRQRRRGTDHRRLHHGERSSTARHQGNA